MPLMLRFCDGGGGVLLSLRVAFWLPLLLRQDISRNSLIDRRLNRENDADDTPVSKFALGFHGPAVKLRDVLHDRKTQPGTAELAAPCFVRTIESLKDARHITRGNADSFIGHGDADAVADPVCLQGDLSFRLRILHCVIEQVIDDLLQAVFVGRYHWARVSNTLRFIYRIS